MPTDKAVINASPFIILAKTGLIGILPSIYTEIWMPETVSTEINQGKDTAAEQLREIELQDVWLKRCLVPVADDILIWNLGGGESEVLSLALESGEHTALIDDRAARKCAMAHDIKTLGTAGIIVLAKRHGIISNVAEELKKLQTAGLWLSDDVIATTLNLADE